MAAAPGELLGTCAAAAVVSEPLAAPSSPSTTTGGVTLGVGWDVADASGDRVACAEAEDVAAEEAEANEEKVATPERVLVVEGVCEGDTVVLGVPVPDGVAVPVGVGEGVDAGVPVPDRELDREVEGVMEGDAPKLSVEVGVPEGEVVALAVGDRVTVEEAVGVGVAAGVPLPVGVGVAVALAVVVPVPVPVSLEVPVGEGVDAGVPVPDKELDREVEGVLEADAPGDSEEVGDTLLVLLALTVVEGVDGGVTVALGE